MQRGFLTSAELMRYFERFPICEEQRHQCLSVGMVDLESLIRRFNKDKLNGRIALPEFLDELTPKLH